MTVELRHLRVFLAVAEQLNLSRAAFSLHTTQPAVTRTLRQLEDHLGTTLVSRSTHHVALTEDGEAFRTQASEIVAGFDDLVVPAPLPEAPLRVGHAWSALGAFTPTVVQRWRNEQTAAPLELNRFDDRLAGRRDRRADIGILRGPITAPSTHVEPLFRERRLAALPVGHALADRDVVTLAELASEPVIYNTVSGTTKLALWPADGRPAGKVKVGNTDDWASAISSGAGFGMTGESTAFMYPYPGLVYVPVQDVAPIQVSLGWPTRGAHRLTGDFVVMVKHIVADGHSPCA